LSIKLKEKSSSKPSSEVFDFLMKSLADSWFTSLFSSTLLTSDFLRVFDCLLIQGFDFIILFALALLGKNQRFFRNSLKNEVKLIKTEKTLELLKVSATSAKLKLLQKLEKVPIEKLIKKCLNKPSYTSLFKLNIKPVFDDQLEIKTREKTLREARETIGPISRDTALIILNSLEIFENFSQITRSTFSDFFSKNFQWPGQKTIQFFSVFDQQGNDSLQVFSVKISLVLLVFGINNQLELMFKCSDQDNTGFISRVDLIKLVKTVEELLYFRSVFYSENCEKNLMNFEKIDLNQFKSLSKEEFLLPLFEKVFFLNENSPEKIELESPKNRFIEFNLSSPEKSPVLGFSENDVDTDEIPRLELDHLIEVIGENGVNVSVISFEKRKSQVKPAFVHLPQDFETVEIVKDPEFLVGKCSGSEEFHEGKAWDHQINEDWERNEEEKKRMLESHKGFDILPDVQRVKERNGCSRLCSTQTCLLF
jgi:Ca2+-binding EF-hand superfamily protein